MKFATLISVLVFCTASFAHAETAPSFSKTKTTTKTKSARIFRALEIKFWIKLANQNI